MLINCPECGKEVSDKAVSCPNCGFPIPVKRAKKSSHTSHNSSKRMRLPNGFGRITELKGRNLRKPFRVMISDGKTEYGKPIGKLLKPVAYFETYNDAYQALMHYHENPYNYSTDITMEQLYERWIEVKRTRVTQGRIGSIEAGWRYCHPLYHKKVQDVKTRDIKPVIDNPYKIDKNGHEVKGSANTKHIIKDVLSAMMDYAIEYEIITINPVKAIKSMEPSKHVPHITFTDDEWQIILKEKDTDPVAETIYVQCYMGWRPTELLDLETYCLNMVDWCITGGNKTKAGKNRIVPVHKNIRPIIQKHYNDAVMSGCPYLFPLHKRYYAYTTYRYHFGEFIKKHNMNPVHKPHDCRKHFVTMAKKAGVDEYALKHIVGHTIKDLTERVYTDRDIKWLQEEINKIP